MKISIIVPSFNQGRFLGETLDCILSQNESDWECIIMDDGSIDNTREIANLYSKKDARIRYYYQKNQGVCVARNNAIKLSSGEYILCLDGDDLISSNFLQLLSEILDKDKNVKVVRSSVKLFGRRNRIIEYPEYSIERLMGANLFVMTSMFRRCDFDKTKGFNNNMALGLEDWDFWLSLLKSGGKVSTVKEAWFYYRIRKMSRNSYVPKYYRELRWNIYENHKELFSTHFFDPTYSFEYLLVADSYEYKIGKIFMAPFRFFIKKV